MRYLRMRDTTDTISSASEGLVLGFVVEYARRSGDLHGSKHFVRILTMYGRGLSVTLSSAKARDQQVDEKVSLKRMSSFLSLPLSQQHRIESLLVFTVSLPSLCYHLTNVLPPYNNSASPSIPSPRWLTLKK